MSKYHPEIRKVIKANYIRNACLTEANDHLEGEQRTALLEFTATATDDELLRFAELLKEATDEAHRYTDAA